MCSRAAVPSSVSGETEWCCCLLPCSSAGPSLPFLRVRPPVCLGTWERWLWMPFGRKKELTRSPSLQGILCAVAWGPHSSAPRRQPGLCCLEGTDCSQCEYQQQNYSAFFLSWCFTSQFVRFNELGSAHLLSNFRVSILLVSWTAIEIQAHKPEDVHFSFRCEPGRCNVQPCRSKLKGGIWKVRGRNVLGSLNYEVAWCFQMGEKRGKPPLSP